MSSELQRELAGMTYPLPLPGDLPLRLFPPDEKQDAVRPPPSPQLPPGGPTWEASTTFSAHRPLNGKFHPEDEERSKK